MRSVVELNDAANHLRELLVMSKPELIREANHPDICSKTTKNELIVFAFERKFNPKARPPALKSGQSFNGFGKQIQ